MALMGNGALKRGASFFPLGWRKEGEGAYLVRDGWVDMSRGAGGSRCCRRLGCEAVLAWCLPECGCVCPKPLQHLCIRMCSSLSSLLACALPRSLPTTTPVPGEGIFFLSAFTSLATVQGPVREAERLAASCIIHALPQPPWLLLPPETPHLHRLPLARPVPGAGAGVGLGGELGEPGGVLSPCLWGGSRNGIIPGWGGVSAGTHTSMRVSVYAHPCA